MNKMTNVRSSGRPDEITVTSNSVMVASNIHEYAETVDEYTMSGYEYDYDIYTKDEYIAYMANQAKKIQELQEELAATKILLGVE